MIIPFSYYRLADRLSGDNHMDLRAHPLHERTNFSVDLADVVVKFDFVSGPLATSSGFHRKKLMREAVVYGVLRHHADPALLIHLNLPLSCSSTISTIQLDVGQYPALALIFPRISGSSNLQSLVELQDKFRHGQNELHILITKYLEMSMAFARAGYLDTDEKLDNIIFGTDEKGQFRCIKIDLSEMIKVHSLLFRKVDYRFTWKYTTAETFTDPDRFWKADKEKAASAHQVGMMAGNIFSILTGGQSPWKWVDMAKHFYIKPFFNHAAYRTIPVVWQPVAELCRQQILARYQERMEQEAFYAEMQRLLLDL